MTNVMSRSADTDLRRIRRHRDQVGRLAHRDPAHLVRDPAQRRAVHRGGLQRPQRIQPGGRHELQFGHHSGHSVGVVARRVVGAVGEPDPGRDQPLGAGQVVRSDGDGVGDRVFFEAVGPHPAHRATDGEGRRDVDVRCGKEFRGGIVDQVGMLERPHTRVEGLPDRRVVAGVRHHVGPG